MPEGRLLNTERCVLDRVRAEDREDVLRLKTDAEVRRFLGGPIAEETFDARFAGMLAPEPGSYCWSIRTENGNAFIGLVYLGPHHDGETEVSYELLPAWWGKGLAAEAVGAVISFALNELNLPRVVAETQSANRKSRQLLERLGMRLIDSVERFGAPQVIYSTA